MTGPQTRQWLKERIFGPEEDFTYSGAAPTPTYDTTATPTPETAATTPWKARSRPAVRRALQRALERARLQAARRRCRSR